MENSDRLRSSAQSIRWWPAVFIIAVAGVLLWTIVYRDDVLTYRPAITAAATLVTAGAALFAWLMSWSNIGLRGRLRLLALTMLLAIAFCLSVYVEGFRGDGRPMLAWRWAPDPEGERTAHREREVLRPTIGADVDLTRTSAGDSPQFRGPDRSGIVSGLHLARDWSRFPPRLVWRQPVGGGWSSFAAVGEFCVTQEQRGEYETVVCYELRSGAERWEHRTPVRFSETMGGDGPRATPTIEQGRVYALGATGILTCLDGHDGREVWSRDILTEGKCANRPFGMCGSPLVVEDKVLVAPGCPGHSLVAYHRDTGTPLWAAGDAAAAYSSPVLGTFGGRRQVLNFNAEGLCAHDLQQGAVLWSYPWVTPPEQNNVCQPVPLPPRPDRPSEAVFVSSGYGKGCAVLAIEGSGEEFRAHPLWSNRNLAAKFTSVVVRGDFVYGLDEHVMTCLDLRTGARRWKAGRFGYGQLLLVEDLLLVQTEGGEIGLVEASPEGFRELGRFPALENRTWAHPVLAGRMLLVRSDREAACYELAVE